MTNIIETTYKTLANTGELDLTEKDTAPGTWAGVRAVMPILRAPAGRPAQMC